jgi:hypothetical protein
LAAIETLATTTPAAAAVICCTVSEPGRPVTISTVGAQNPGNSTSTDHRDSAASGINNGKPS